MTADPARPGSAASVRGVTADPAGGVTADPARPGSAAPVRGVTAAPAGRVTAYPLARVEVVRSGFVESVHTGSAVVLAPDGTVAHAAGDPDAPMLPRSANKPLQLAGMLRAGLTLPPPDLAVCASSHSGEPMHVRRVRDLLAGAGISADALVCPPSLPLDEPAAHAVLRAGGGPERVLMNCSGKHTAMLLTCAANGWPLDGYADPAHPVQVAIRAAVEELAGQPVAAVAVDGCGAPLFGLSLRGLAAAFARLVGAAPGSPERAVADAMRAYPELVGGTGRDVTRLMAGVPGLLAKDGAEGVFAVATPDGWAAAVKITDGTARARTPLLVDALRRTGLHAAVLDELAAAPVLGGGHPVGSIRSCADAWE
jgi:L-asparaginase II